MTNFKKAMCITSGDLPAFERGLAAQGYGTCEWELVRPGDKPSEADYHAAYVYRHEGTGRMKILLSFGNDRYLFEQANIAPIFDSGDDEAVAHSSNPNLRAD